MIDDKFCRSLTPCYNQVRIKFRNWKEWVSWCAPAAFSIIYWFYDFYWKTNLIPWNWAPILSYNNWSIINLQQKLAELMYTSLEDWSSTINKNLQFWFDYLLKKNNLYKDYEYRLNSNVRKDIKLIDSDKSWSFDMVKREIWGGRPVLLSYNCWLNCWHIVVVHWFKDNKFLANFWHQTDANIIMDVYWNTFTSSEWNWTIDFYWAFEIL